MTLGRMKTYEELYPVTGAKFAPVTDVPTWDVGNGVSPIGDKERNHASVTIVPKRRTAWSAPELMAAEFAEPRWAIPGIVAEGATLLAGSPKVGKSWLALNLAVAVASGGKALGSTDVEMGDVLYLALEDTGRRLQSRLELVLQNQLAPGRLDFATECPTFFDGGAERIRTWCDRHDERRLLIVDVFTRLRGSVSDRSNRYEADYIAMGAIKTIADEYGVAIIVVHHTRKAAAEDYLDAVSGSQGIAGAADSVLVLTRSRGRAQAVLKVTGRDIEEAEYALDFDAHIGTWRMLDGPASDYTLSDERRAILTAVRDTEGLGPKAIAEVSGVKYGVVKHLVRKMLDDGTLDTDGDGHYFVHSVHRVHSDDVSAGQPW